MIKQELDKGIILLALTIIMINVDTRPILWTVLGIYGCLVCGYAVLRNEWIENLKVSTGRPENE